MINYCSMRVVMLNVSTVECYHGYWRVGRRVAAAQVVALTASVRACRRVASTVVALRLRPRLRSPSSPTPACRHFPARTPPRSWRRLGDAYWRTKLAPSRPGPGQCLLLHFACHLLIYLEVCGTGNLRLVPFSTA